MKRCPKRNIISILVAMLLLASCASTASVTPQDKKMADAARNLGEAYLIEKRYTTALGEFHKAEKLNPDDPILLHDMGLTYMAMGKYARAVIPFQKAIQLKPGYSMAKNSLGSAYIELGEWDKAIAVLEQVTDDLLYATPHFPLANLGWAYFNKRDYKEAQQYLEEALELQPEFYIAQLNLGRVYLATGRPRQALALFEELAPGNPKNPVLLLNLGKAYRMIGDYNSARLTLKGAIQFTEDTELALEASRELSKLP